MRVCVCARDDKRPTTQRAAQRATLCAQGQNGGWLRLSECVPSADMLCTVARSMANEITLRAAVVAASKSTPATTATRCLSGFVDEIPFVLRDALQSVQNVVIFRKPYFSFADLSIII